MKKLAVAFVVCSSMLLAGCPKQVNAGRTTHSEMGSASNRWGTPNTRISTAGFNGSPSQQVGEKSNSSEGAVPIPGH